MTEFTKEQNKVIGKAIEAEYETGFHNGADFARLKLMELLSDLSKCTTEVDEHDMRGFCFCEAIPLMDTWKIEEKETK
jgi:hypothetical protein